MRNDLQRKSWRDFFADNGLILSDMRTTKGLSIREVARRMRCSPYQVRALERGVTGSMIHVLLDYAKACQFTIVLTSTGLDKIEWAIAPAKEGQADAPQTTA